MLLVAADGRKPVRRRYTIRQFDPARLLLTIDVVLHGDGPGERWVRSAQAGDRIEGIGPRGKIFPSPEADWHLFMGDEAAMPAILAMTESLPGDADATVVHRGSRRRRRAGGARPRPGPGSAGCTGWAGRPATGRTHWPPRPPRSSCRPAAGTPTCSARRRSCCAMRERAGRPRAAAGPDVAEGVLGPRPRQCRPRRARQGRLSANWRPYLRQAS